MPLSYNAIQQYISAARLQNYENVCAGNTDKAIKLYHTNLRLSQAFYPLLSLLEVILRNALNEELSNNFTDPNWLITQQRGFMMHPSLSYRDPTTGRMKHNYYLKLNVEKSINKAGTHATQGKIIADLSFGFWTALFEPVYFSILSARPMNIFSKLPPSTKRKVVYKKLKKLNDFRNRVYHNEAIIFGKDSFGNNVFSLNDAKEIYQEIQEFFRWLDLDFNEWTKSINNINFEIERAECMIKVYPSKKYYVYRINIGLKHYTNKYL